MGFVHVLPTLHLVISITDHTYAQATLNNEGDEGLNLGSRGGEIKFFSKVAQNRLKRILVYSKSILKFLTPGSFLGSNFDL